MVKLFAQGRALVSGSLNPFHPYKRYFPHMTFGSYHKKIIGYQPVKMVSPVGQMGLTTTSSLPALYHSSSFPIIYIMPHTPSLTLPGQGTVTAPGPHGSLTCLVTWRAATSLPPLHPPSPSQPLGDNLVLTPILWLVGFDAATAKICGLTPQPSKTLCFHS